MGFYIFHTRSHEFLENFTLGWSICTTLYFWRAAHFICSSVVWEYFVVINWRPSVYRKFAGWCQSRLFCLKKNEIKFIKLNSSNYTVYVHIAITYTYTCKWAKLKWNSETFFMNIAGLIQVDLQCTRNYHRPIDDNFYYTLHMYCMSHA